MKGAGEKAEQRRKRPEGEGARHRRLEGAIVSVGGQQEHEIAAAKAAEHVRGHTAHSTPLTSRRI